MTYKEMLNLCFASEAEHTKMSEDATARVMANIKAAINAETAKKKEENK